MSTWLSWCVKSPGPATGYTGYDNDPDRRLDEIRYVVNHSAEGGEAFLKAGHRPSPDPKNRASWTFSNCLNGTMYQHFPLEAITYTSGGYAQNVSGLGVEHEGFAPDLINDQQVQNDLRLWNDLMTLCPNLKEQQFGEGYREHSELTGGSTACPSGRIQPLYEAIQEADMKTVVAKFTDGFHYALRSDGTRVLLGTDGKSQATVERSKAAADLLVSLGLATYGPTVDGQKDGYWVPSFEVIT